MDHNLQDVFPHFKDSLLSFLNVRSLKFGIAQLIYDLLFVPGALQSLLSFENPIQSFFVYLQPYHTVTVFPSPTSM